jgi:hypothetical protein
VSLQAIRNILNSRLSSSFPTLSIAWENTNFTPPTNAPHVRVSFLPSETRPAANHASAMDFESGIYQLDLYVPQNTGTANADATAREIRRQFKRGLALFDVNNIQVMIQGTPSVSDGRIEGPFWRSRITVPWFAYVPAPPDADFGYYPFPLMTITDEPVIFTVADTLGQRIDLTGMFARFTFYLNDITLVLTSGTDAQVLLLDQTDPNTKGMVSIQLTSLQKTQITTTTNPRYDFRILNWLGLGTEKFVSSGPVSITEG